ncbi:hypothetical protein QYE76_048558 [Lolium multiflorum]|uniref:Disease resistance protein RPM1 n=1 Tax=Lolium multiflorum TaxID=4521 RepID=A0AAD8WFH2_LOLMU|nr:hypothetical protein QYE76_048558 [Lolium multiflorum]
MAEFALGLTKTAVEGTLSRVKLAIEENAKLKIRVQNDLMFITGEFQMMQSFLNAANAERTRNDVVQTWVKQVRDLAFDVEDCVEFVVHLDKGSPWTNWFWRVLPSCIAPSLPLDEAVTELKQLKARVEDVSQRNTRYNLISDTGSGSKHPVSVSSLVPELMPTSTEVHATSDAFDNLCKVWESTGKLRGSGDLHKLINNEGDDLEVISLWQSPGAGHLGVTHVIRQAYNHPEINRNFKSMAWIKLLHPFNPDEFLKTLLSQVFASSHHQSNIGVVDFRRKMKAAVAIEDELMQQMCKQRYLVIVEELSTVSEWDAIRMYLPNSKNGSRIVVATQELGLALSCTGDPYQVSILRQLSDGQSLCAFFNKVSGRRSDMSELILQLRRPGVVSVWNDNSLVDKVYTCITHKSKEICGVGFKRHVRVDLPNNLHFMDFCRRLLLSFHSDDFQAKEIREVFIRGDGEIIERCRRFLRENECLIVIGGLNYRTSWNCIKETFLSEPIQSCILALADGHPMAIYCVDEECRLFNAKDLDADTVLRRSVKDYDYYRFEGREESSMGCLFPNRRKRASDWINKFQHMVPLDRVSGWLLDRVRGGGVISLWGTPGDGRSAIARRIYYKQLLFERENGMPPPPAGYYQENPDLGFINFSWIEVPNPFDLTDLCWRLILDFYSDNMDKERVAVDMMYREPDPIQRCRSILHESKCLVVVRGLQSTDDWDKMRDALLSHGPISGCIIVITNEESVAKYCVHKDGQVFISQLRKDRRVLSRTGELVRKPSAQNHRRCIFSSRMEEARDWFNKFELIGHYNEFRSILEQLEQHDSCVISVWGIAGAGKSYVVRSIYYSDMIGIESNYIGCLGKATKYSWVDVPHPFNLSDLSWRLLMDLHSDDLAAKETMIIGMMEGQDPIQECRKLLHQYICFFVIRGLRSIDDWDLMKAALLPERVKGCILVITNDKSVATHCAQKDRVVNVKGLDANATDDLFRKIIQDDRLLLSNKVVEFSKLILAKCGGLPRVITAMGKYCKNLRWFWEVDSEILNKPKENLLHNIDGGFMTWLETDQSFRDLRSLFCWMQSYFDACSDSLKPCIFYLSVFPASQNIRRKRLLKRWIAEGYSRDTSGSSALENGERLFSELVGLSIIHQSAEVCQVNGFFHEYIISRPMEDNLVFALKGCCSLNAQRAGQHLAISNNWDRDEIVFRSLDLSRLRSLTVFGKWKSFFISADVNMRLLRVLDLEDTTGLKDGDIEQIGKLLPRLKFLSLRGCMEINLLPDSIGDMRQLQTLDIKNTSIATLPVTIIKLEKLQCIHAGTTHETRDVGDGMVVMQPLVGEDQPSTSIEDGSSNGTATSLPPAEATTSLPAAEGTTSQPPEEATMSLSLAEATTSQAPVEETKPWSIWPRALAPSWLSKLSKHALVGGTEHNGVKLIPAAAKEIGKLTALHTLGVVNVGGTSGGNTVLTELRKLTQLRKLRLSGINLKNWELFCSAISGRGYLESLSVRLAECPGSSVVFANFSNILEPPKTLKTLKVYGKNTHISPDWIKQLHNLTKVDLDLTLSTQQDIVCTTELPRRDIFRRVCVRPITEDELTFGSPELVEFCESDFYLCNLQILKIDCRYTLACNFGARVGNTIEVVVVHCSTVGSSWDLSGLEKLWGLKEVWLTGSYSDELKQQLQQKVAQHQNKPVLKLEAQPRSRSVCYNCCV